jgi:hypothetical protein
VHPSRKLVRAGDKVAFRALVLDSEGCPTGLKPQWAILPGPLSANATLDGNGTLSVDATAPEGNLEVSAGIAGKAIRLLVEVVSPTNYDAWLQSMRSSDAGYEEQPAVATIASGTIGGGTAIAEDTARRRKILFVFIAASVALLLTMAGLAFARRGRVRSFDRPLSSGVAPEATSDGGAPSPRGAEGNIRSPAVAPVASHALGASRGKVCPTCGEHYAGDAEYCGRDATKLFPVN